MDFGSGFMGCFPVLEDFIDNKFAWFPKLINFHYDSNSGDGKTTL